MNRKTGWIVVVVLLCIIIIGLLFLLFMPSNKAQAPAQTTQGTQQNTASTTAPEATLDDLIKVDRPLPHGVIDSPLTIEGSARGSWYFEASAPVELRDGNGVVVAQGHIQAQGDWMTQDYVPFTATLTFTKPATQSGTLVLMNDNPSGDPSRQKELDIPVAFPQ